MPPRPVTGPPPHPSFFLARRPPEGPAVADHRHRSDRLPPQVSDLVARFPDLLPAPRCLRPYGPAVSSGLPPSLPWFSVPGHRRPLPRSPARTPTLRLPPASCSRTVPTFTGHGHRRHPPGRGAPPARPSSGRRCVHAVLRCSPPRAAAPRQLVLPAPANPQSPRPWRAPSRAPHHWLRPRPHWPSTSLKVGDAPAVPGAGRCYRRMRDAGPHL
nr:vegetative cell wall protein gp1-like [Aegilops tauschii subsp. strangulata]